MKTSQWVLAALLLILIVIAGVSLRSEKKRYDAELSAISRRILALETRTAEIERKQRVMTDRQDKEQTDTSFSLRLLSKELSRYYKLHEVTLDCTRKFGNGVFGIPSGNPEIATILKLSQNLEAVYIVKTGLKGFEGDCQHVSALHYFRLVYVQQDGLDYAGCYGDFDGDSKRDYALLLTATADRKARPYVFLQRDASFLPICLWGACDKYGYGEETRDPPGPFRVDHPADGIFRSPFDEQTPHVMGDLIQLDWYTYFWTSQGRFEAVQTQD